MSEDNSKEILEVAKNYYDKIQIVYDEAIKLGDGRQYLRQKQQEYKDNIYIALPIWLVTALEVEDHWHFMIMKDEITKRKSKK